MSNESVLPSEMDIYKIEALEKMDIYESEEKQTFIEWLNRSEYVATCIGVPENKMIEFFNKMVHDDVHKCIKESVPYIDFSKLSYEQLIHLYYRKINPAIPKDPHTLYMVNLFKQADESGKPEEFRDKILCAQFIHGLRSEEIRKYLKEHPYDTFEETVAKAIELEKAQK